MPDYPPEAYNVAINALRDNWEGEAVPDETVEWIFIALDGMESWTLPLDDAARERAARWASAVFADFSGSVVPYDALASNVLRAFE